MNRLTIARQLHNRLCESHSQHMPARCTFSGMHADPWFDAADEIIRDIFADADQEHYIVAKYDGGSGYTDVVSSGPWEDEKFAEQLALSWFKQPPPGSGGRVWDVKIKSRRVATLEGEETERTVEQP